MNEYLSRAWKQVLLTYGDDGIWGSPCSAYCYIPLQSPQAFINQPKAFVISEGYYQQHLFKHISYMSGVDYSKVYHRMPIQEFQIK